MPFDLKPLPTFRHNFIMFGSLLPAYFLIKKLSGLLSLSLSELEITITTIPTGPFVVGTLELSNPLGVGQKEGKCPVLRQHCNIFSLIAQSNSVILSISMCDFLFQLTSSFVIGF